MNTILVSKNKFRRMFVNVLSIFVILALAFPVTTVAAAKGSPFVGQWRGSDPDGSETRLTIAGRPDGPFQITWTESYIGFCNGEAGIVRGTGWLNESNSNLLEADLHLECFTTGATLDFHITWRYHSATNTLSSSQNGVVTIWHRPGGGHTGEPPALDLRVNYGHDWVESFYEGGHTAWVTVTDSDGNLKATIELVTEPKWYWGGATGFQSVDGVWFDADGNQMDTPPDILPNDWVYGWVDNGASAQVQIGDISGMIDLNADSIDGTIYAPWFSDPVQVECLDWGSGSEPPFDTQDGGLILPNGEATYSCSWFGEWDIQYYQNVGLAYFGLDGHWVANAFFARNPRLVVFPEWEWFDGNDWPDGATVDITVLNKPECSTSQVSWGNFFNGSFGESCDVVVGDTVTFTDGATVRTHTVRNLGVSAVDAVANTVSGTADPFETVYVWQHAPGEQTPAEADEYGEWFADLSAFYDIQPGSSGRSEIRDEFGNATAVDWYVPNPHFAVFLEWEYIEGWEWPDGALVSAVVDGKPECSVEGTSGHPDWDPNALFLPLSLPQGCDIAGGDVVTLTDGVTTRMHTVQNLTITAVNKDTNTITGTADPGVIVHVWPHATGQQLDVTVGGSGNWQVDYTDIFDLVEGTNGRSEIRDEQGNSTAVEWRIPNPRFSVFPEWEYIEGWDWPDGALVTATVNEKPQCEAQGISGPPDWDPNVLFVPLWLPEGCDVAAGDVVTLTDSVTTRMYTIQNLTITAVDKDADTITGTADAGALIHVWPHGYNELLPTADADGNWVADFSETGPDLVEGMGGRTEIRDEFGNATAVEWRILNPYIEAAPFSDWIHAREWPLGTLMTLEIDDPSDGLGDVDYSATATMEPAPWNPNDPNDILADFRWPDEFAPGPGYVLTMSGDGQSKTLTISDLYVTSFDPGADTISGVGTPNAQIQVCANVPNRCITRWVIPDGDGNWTANYGIPGTGNDDPDTFDVQPGSNGWAAEYEADSDRTWFDWWVPNPHIIASISDDWFYVNEFAPNVELEFAVYASEGGTLIWQGTTPTTDGSGHVSVDANGRWDLEPGTYLVVSDGTSTKDIVIEGFTFDVFDLTQGILQGTAPGPEGRHVWVGIGFQDNVWTLDVMTDSSGNWVADFGEPVPGDYQWVAAQISDADGDASELRPSEIIN